jgi:hypothetical protein
LCRPGTSYTVMFFSPVYRAPTAGLQSRINIFVWHVLQSFCLYPSHSSYDLFGIQLHGTQSPSSSYMIPREQRLMTWRLLTPGLYPHIVLWGGTLHHSYPFNNLTLTFLIPHTESILSALTTHVPPQLMHAIQAVAPPLKTHAWLDRRDQTSRNRGGGMMMAHSDESEGPSGG